jgi:hypothetical protein
MPGICTTKGGLKPYNWNILMHTTTWCRQFAKVGNHKLKIRKLRLNIISAPQTSAIGFRQTVHKLLCIVQLLMGEMPDRTVFAQKDLRNALRPYLRLAQAIRVGDLVAFHEVVDQFSDIFKADKTYPCLIVLHTFHDD